MMARGKEGEVGDGGSLWTVDHTVAEVKRAAARPVNGEMPANKVLSTGVGSGGT